MNRTIHTTAVYQDGVLKPTTPLPLANGDRVEVTVVTPATDRDTPEEVARREQALKAFDERTAALQAAEPDGDYDILEALNANRLAEGARPLLPPEGAR